MPITYTKGDATQPVGQGDKLILHVCNNLGRWGAGFVLALNKRWSEPREEYMKLVSYSLGAVQFVHVTPDITVVNMIAQSGVNNRFTPHKKRIREDALENCLQKVRSEYAGNKVSIHMPRIGCGLGGGKWSDIEKIISQSLDEFEVFVYDLP